MIGLLKTRRTKEVTGSSKAQDKLLYDLTKIAEDVKSYFEDDTHTPSHTDGLNFHKGKCNCCEIDILGDIDKALANPVIPKPRG